MTHERNGDRVTLRALQTGQYADDSLSIAISVRQNNVGAVLAAFPAQAYSADSTRIVLDVTEFFTGDTPALSGLDAAQRRQYQVRRLDAARSSLDAIRSYPMNVEVHQTQTFDAGAPPSDADAASMTVMTRQSIVLLPSIVLYASKCLLRLPQFAAMRWSCFTCDATMHRFAGAGSDEGVGLSSLVWSASSLFWRC